MLSLIEFKQQLSNFTTTEQIANFIRTFDVSASNTTENSTSVFYTKSIDGDVNNPIWQIANTIQAEGNGAYKVLNNSTDAAFYLNDQNGYRLAILDTLKEITGIDDQNILNNQFFNGRVEDGVYKQGYWDIVSEKMAQEAKGNVIALVPFSGQDNVTGAMSKGADNSVWAKTELPALLQNENVTHINGIPKSDLLDTFSRSGIDGVFDAVRNVSLQQFAATGLINSGVISQTTIVNGLDDFLNEASKNIHTYYLSHPEATQKFIDNLNALKISNPDAYTIFSSSMTDIRNHSITHDPITGVKVLKPLFVIATIGGLLLTAGQAGAAELSGDREGAKKIITDWAIDASGSGAGELIGTAIAGVVGTALVAGGIISTPVSGALVFAGSIIGSIFGSDAAKDLYELSKDKDDNGKMDMFDRMVNFIYGATEFRITDPTIVSLVGGILQKIYPNISSETIIQNAKTDIAWRYALYALNPFVIYDISYNNHNLDGKLDLYHPDTGLGMTEDYLKDRADMLAWFVRYYTGQLDDDDSLSDIVDGYKPYDDNWDTDAIEGNWDYIALDRTLRGVQQFKLTIDGKGLSRYYFANGENNFKIAS